MINNLIITGNLGKDPEIKFTPDGKAIGSFSLAVGQRMKKDNEWVDAPPMWLQVKFFGTQGEKIIDRFSKGDTVTVSGRLTQSHWTDKDGVEKVTLEVFGSDVVKIERQKSALAEESAPVIPIGKAPF